MYYRNFEDEIKTIYAENKTRYANIIRGDEELFNWLKHRCATFTDYLPEMVYSVLHPDENPFCALGNKRKFRTITVGWNRCSLSGCPDCMGRSLSRARDTSLARYGVDNPMKNPEIKEKVVKSAVSNGSYAAAVVKRRGHYLSTIGAEHPWKTAEGKKKHVEAMVEKYGCRNPSLNRDIIEKKRQNNLRKHGVENAIDAPGVREKIKNILLDKYGVVNPSQIPEVQESIKKTSLEKYGVEHFTQSEHIKMKGQATSLSRYGQTNYNKTPESKQAASKKRLDTFFDHLSDRVGAATPLFTREEYTGVHGGQKYKWLCNICSNIFTDGLDDGKIPRCTTCHPSHKSMGEHDMAMFVESLGFDIIRNSRSIISPMELDIYIPEKNIAFEYNGVYHHSELSGGKGRNYHLNKRQMCAAAGIQLIQILDVEWLNKNDLVKSRIKQKLGISSTIYARKCTVDICTSASANLFHQENHIQSGCNGSIHYGLFYGGVLVSAMSFGKSRYSKLADYELLRFSSLKNYTVVGGAAKLLAAFEGAHNYPSIVSYCDLRWNTGGVYEKIGFKFHENSPPNYWYHKQKGILESRIKYQKHKLKTLLDKYDNGLTEWGNMASNGFDRIWDCGNAIFLKNKLSNTA